MAHLTLAGVSDDGKRLLLVSDAGVEFTLDIDARLRAALRGDHARLGQLETQMDSALRPRDIQARIRAGETPEAVAQAAQTTVDKIMAFAAPVLAERQHVADRAQRSSVRRRSGADQAAGGARTLGDVVAAHLRSQHVDPESVEWDAWRREDGRWALTGEFASTKRSGHAQFTFDAPGNYVTADNEDARWLLGEVAVTNRIAEPHDDLQQARRRRLSAVAEDELPLGDDAIEMVTEPALGSEQPVEAFLTEEPPPAEELDLREEAADAAALDESTEPTRDAVPPQPEAEPEPAAEEAPARRPVRKSRGRASVPSWDEIMFGGGKSE
ncbi:septation protein SepH [Nocardioides sp. MAHUQ-72]|uniref:septation protein SepH n=1 Tax=unclassified Nocardioides TaxID=2615069 RepID=UPI00360D78DC